MKTKVVLFMRYLVAWVRVSQTIEPEKLRTAEKRIDVPIRETRTGAMGIVYEISGRLGSCLTNHAA